MISTLDQGICQGAKWLKTCALIDKAEFGQLVKSLGTFWMVPVGKIGEGEPIPLSLFLEEYGTWMESLQQGLIPSEESLKKYLAAIWTQDLQAVWKKEIPGKGYLVKISQPVVQVQAHFFTYSPIDQVFRSMSMGPESVFWGLQFSFPQVIQNAKTMEITEVSEHPLFKLIRTWIRDATRATPFIVAGKKINVPMRLGKTCFSWIHKHPQLQAAGIGVEGAG